MIAGIARFPFAGGPNKPDDHGFSVTFPKLMPNLDYTLQVTFVDPHGLGQWFTVRNRSTKGFSVGYHRPRYLEAAPARESLAPCEVEVHWQVAGTSTQTRSS